MPKKTTLFLKKKPSRNQYRYRYLKIDVDIFEEPENERVFLDIKVYKNNNFIQSRLYMAMQGCDLVLRV